MTDSFGDEVERLHDAVGRIVSRAGEGDVAEVFAERSFKEHLTLSYGRRNTHGAPSEFYDHEELAGASVRTIHPSGTRFKTVDALQPAELERAAQEMIPNSAGPPHWTVEPRGSLEVPADAVVAVSLQEKRSLLEAAADAALSLEPNLQELDVSLQGRVRLICVWASDIQPTLTATAHVGIRVSASNGRTSTNAVDGSTGGIGYFLTSTPESIAEACISRLHALGDVESTAAIERELPVVIEGGWGGVWLHETVGHLLEADVDSPFSKGGIGTRVGSEHVTVVDDGTTEGGRGTSLFDDEGTPSQRTVLIEQGILRNMMTDRRTRGRTQRALTGNGRRQDYRHEPLPRMTNLMLENGPIRTPDLLGDVKRGLYVRTIGSGEVRPADDRFQFEVVEGYVIENGRLMELVTGLYLSGSPSDMLKRIVAVGDDFKVDPARGTCVKAGQAVPVSVGMPTVLLDELTIEMRADETPR